MKAFITFLAACSVLCLMSCSGKPSDKEIKQKILLDYICAEHAKVDDLKIISTEETKNLMGGVAYKYTVSGSVEWPDGCNEFGSQLPSGAKEKFEKIVFLSKDEQGKWQ
jgi:hypothetical protein